MIDDRELRMVLVALNDAVAWCETAANLADQLLDIVRTGRPATHAELVDAKAQLADMRRYLEANETQIRRITARGLSDRSPSA